MSAAYVRTTRPYAGYVKVTPARGVITGPIGPVPHHRSDQLESGDGHQCDECPEIRYWTIDIARIMTIPTIPAVSPILTRDVALPIRPADTDT